MMVLITSLANLPVEQYQAKPEGARPVDTDEFLPAA
jgi:hypothetical protein